MATLAEQRAQIAEGMRRSRQGTSEASRRATGQAMIERRTGRAEVDDINALVTPPRQRKPLPGLAPRGSVPPQRGRGNYTAPVGGTGGGIASPLVEQSGTRVFYEEVLRPSTDGAVFFAVRAARRLTMTDANGEAVVLEFDNAY